MSMAGVELHEFGVGDAGAGECAPWPSAAPSACGGLVVRA